MPTPLDREIALRRIEIAEHDAFAELGQITEPTLVICGEFNMCTPLPLSEELHRGIPNSELAVLENAGELIEIEKDAEYYNTVSEFIARHL